MTSTPSWWQTGVIYQIYPRSFMDSNSDGVGDLPGITSKLDYLQWLGIDAIWISPMYPSPMADFGYDISNYTDVHPLFGNLSDMETLIQAAHARNIKVILDYVPNHTSDEHPWFIESRSNRTNPKRDWYLWQDPGPNGQEPNNWTSLFGGSAWQLDPQTNQYYLHLFDVKQADLNWRNPDVRAAMYDALRFWLDRGIDGFRVDVLWMLIKDEQLRDNPMNPDWRPGDPPYARQDMVYNSDQPGIHDIVRDMRSILDSYGDRVFIGEIYLPIPKLMHYYGENLDEAHLPFNFQFVTMPGWEASTIRHIVDDYETALPEGAWPNWVLGNHDRPRIASRVGSEQARAAQMLLLTLRGTPTCYYGDELGLQNSIIPPELITDPQGKDNPAHSRDPQRAPMPWDTTPNAGFTTPTTNSDSTTPTITPWLPLAPDAHTCNVATQQQDPRSFLNFTRTLLQLRRTQPALHLGTYQSLDHNNPNCFVFQRTHNNPSNSHTQHYLIALNLSPQNQTLTLPLAAHGTITLSTLMDRTGPLDLSKLSLRANEGLLIELTS